MKLRCMLRDKNIFKDAKFGDRFLTRNQQFAIYDRYNNIRSCHVLLLEHIGEHPYNDNGTLQGTDEYPNFDIVSKETEHTSVHINSKKDKFFNEEFRTGLRTVMRISLLIMLVLLAWFIFIGGVIYLNKILEIII